MGEVVKMSDWRKRNNPVNPQRRIAPWEPTKLDPEALVAAINDLLGKVEGARNSMPFLATVHLREQAVIDSLKFREQADKLAREHGFVIRKSETTGYYLNNIEGTPK